MSDSLNTPS